ncbi:putative signal peptide protein [Puccinia sorghi]|uniref:Putative signal peptide protein n=1 Tax=Puccinia sorghi TaxID=27349 RepID=A0A0L6URF7_9BASI|nr:putative signal peptide protein [Puccinia sorghi]
MISHLTFFDLFFCTLTNCYSSQFFCSYSSM